MLCGYDAFAIPASSQQLTNIKEAQPFIHVFNWDFDIILNRAKDEARDRRVRIWKSRPMVTWASLAKPRREKTSSVRYNVTLSEVVDSERIFRRHAAVRP